MNSLDVAQHVYFGAPLPGTDNHVPSLASVCDFLKFQAHVALKKHDLEEAMFWQNGYLVARMHQRIDFDLSAFTRARESCDYHVSNDGEGYAHNDDCRRCTALVR